MSAAEFYEFTDDGGQCISDTQGGTAPVVGSSAGDEASAHTTPMRLSPDPGTSSDSSGQGTRDAQFSAAAAVGSSRTGGEASVDATPKGPAPTSGPVNPVAYRLGAASDTLDDIESARIAIANRRDALIRDKLADEKDPDVEILDTVLEQLAAIEHGATLSLKREIRKQPLGPWIKETKGIGEKQGARLIAAIGGDPYIRPDGTPRTVSQLWAYCGYHVIDGAAPRRKKGTKSNWSSVAKSRAYLIAEACMKQRESPYRALYDAEREKSAGAVHTSECARCGPTGKPAQPGSLLSDGHKHARALRRVAKEVLKDMWREAKRLHDLDGSGHGTFDAQCRGADPVDSSPLGDHRRLGAHTSNAAEGAPSDHVTGHAPTDDQSAPAGDVVNSEAGAA